MERLFFYCALFFFALLTASTETIDQNSILAGKITDEHNNPVPYAIIKLQDVHKQIITAKADNNGLYYTRQLPSGDYSITIIPDGKKSVANKITITPLQHEKQFYNFCLKDKKAIETITTKDPFISVMLAQKENEDPREDVLFGKPGRNFFIQTDKSGKVISASLPASPAPQIK